MSAELKPGTVVYDCDPRMKGRSLIVERIGSIRVECRSMHGKRKFLITAKRIALDGKPRRTGFSTTKPAHWDEA